MFSKYLKKLSRRQIIWFGVCLIVAILIITLGLCLELDKPIQTENHRYSINMSIKQIAPKLDVTGKGLARELGLPLDIPKKKPLDTFGISQKQLDHATTHILSHHATGLKYYLFAAIVLFGWVYLIRLGRPDKADISQRKLWFPRIPYIACLIISVLVCGFVLGKSPNPMEAIVKVFKSMVGLYPSVISKSLVFAFFILLAMIGNKLICGWACPFGALQELMYHLPILRKVKRRKMPFGLTNSIRGALFAISLLFLFAIIGDKKGFVIYHYLNPFNLFNLDFDHWLILATIIAAITMSLCTYRPFCHLICPFGFVSWIFERLSLTRIIEP